MLRPDFIRMALAEAGPLGLRPFIKLGFGFLLLAAIALLYACMRLGYEPAVALAGISGAAVALILMRKWPMGLMAGLLFVGGFKTVPAQDISLTDPTMIMLLLCAGAVVLDLLFLISGTSRWTLRRLLAGQGAKILIFMLFVAVLTASLLYTPVPQTAISKLARFVAFNILMFCAPMLFLKRGKDMHHFLVVMIFLSLLLMAKEMTDVLHPSEQVLKGNEDITRIGNGMVFSVAILTLLYHKFDCSRVLTFGLLGIFACGVVASAARSAMVALIATILISAMSMLPTAEFMSRKKLLFALSVTVLVASVTLYWIQDKPGIHHKLVAKEHELMAVTSGSKVTGGTIGTRLSFFRSSLDAFTQHPVLGLGLGGWSSFYSKDRIGDYPHNFLLEVAAEQGLIGVTLLLALLGSLFYSAAHFMKHPQVAFLFPVLIFCVICNSVTGDIDSRDLWFWFGMVVAGSRLARESFSSGDTRRAEWGRSWSHL